jgi:DNA replication ATP-dependent helicase Dna2
MTSSFIEDLKDFVNKEQDTQNKQIEEMWAKPLNVRIQVDEAIGNVAIIEVSSRGIVLNCPENTSKFRIGDAVRLHRNVPWRDFAHCEIEQENGNELVVKIPIFSDPCPIPISVGTGWILDRDIVDLRSILLGTLDTIAYNPQWEKYVSAIFSGEIEPSISSQKSISAQRLVENLGFNSKQKEAFCSAYATDNYYLIQGPPGTGKTRIVAELAKTFAAEGQRVLVTAFTHHAINNALFGIAKNTKYSKIIKIGQWQHKEGLRDEELSIDVLNFNKFVDCPYESNKGVIIGATCFACRTSRLVDSNRNRVTFDVVIFDEAGQVTLPVAMMGMLSSMKNIFVGDHKQMAPIIVAEHKNEWVKKSIFETLYQHAPGTMLEVTYRMNEEICQFPSQAFYNGKLIPDPIILLRY